MTIAREKPILFNTEMVRAILDGRKTATRRPIKIELGLADTDKNDPSYLKIPDAYGDYWDAKDLCRYQPGDVLWVREAWRIGAWNEDMSTITVDYKADGFARREWLYVEDEEAFERYWIQSTEDAMKAGMQTDADGKYHWEPGEAPTKWRPSIHMPRVAARLFLEVTDVRVERVQDITVHNVECEGLRPINNPLIYQDKETALSVCQREFKALWDSIYAKKGYGWDANPWVWVYEFKRCEP
jgi:hypothetical protein